MNDQDPTECLTRGENQLFLLKILHLHEALEECIHLIVMLLRLQSEVVLRARVRPNFLMVHHRHVKGRSKGDDLNCVHLPEVAAFLFLVNA